MKKYIELNKTDFMDFLHKYLPFINGNPIVDGICIHAEACKNNLNVRYIYSDIDWESFIDLKVALSSLYRVLFQTLPLGKVLFFYPFSTTKNGNYAVVLDSQYLLDFLIKDHVLIYPEYFNVGMHSFAFYFLEEQIFYGMEHPDFLYSFYMADIG